jgi:hypothetical protein
VGNDMKAEGLLTLIKANWKKISNINLSNNILIKATIKSVTQAASG